MLNAKRNTQKLLAEVGNPVWIPPVKKFIAKELFSDGDSLEVPIAYCCPNLQDRFLDLVEEDIAGTRLRRYRLTNAALDTPILETLSEGKGRYPVVAFAHVIEFLKGVSEGYGERYLFYVADAEKTIGGLNMWRGEGGWVMFFRTLHQPVKWHESHLVIGR